MGFCIYKNAVDSHLFVYYENKYMNVNICGFASTYHTSGAIGTKNLNIEIL